MKNKIRIAKFLSQAGIASRRKSEELILAGRVKINKEVIKDLSFKVNENSNNIYFDNKLIKKEEKEYYLVHKPKGYISSVSDPHNPKTVISLINTKAKIFPVGRLDKDSQGLLLLTNDGDLAYQLTHPKFNIPKTYLVILNKEIEKEHLQKLKKGIRLEEGLARVDKIKLKNKKEVLITIHQGWNRQIRRMFNNLNYKVKELIRLSEGNLKLNNLKLGKYRKIKKEEII